MNPVEPVGIRSFAASYEPLNNLLPAEKKEEKDDYKNVSAYYLTTISSLKASVEVDDNEVISQPQIQNVKTESSTLSKIRQWGEWLIGLFWGDSSKETQKTNSTDIKNTNGVVSLGSAPKLQPEEIDRNRLSKAIIELNRDLVHRLKESNEFEEEMRKNLSDSKNMDKLIFIHLFNSSMKQKTIKEDSSIDKQDEVLRKHRMNKKIQQDFFSLWDDIRDRAKKSSFLGWIGLGSTIGIAGIFAVSLATGGGSTLVALGLPLLSIVQGTTKAAEGILKYQNDIKSGELFLLKEESSENSVIINNNLQEMKNCNDEIAQILKTLRRHLENQSKAERIFHASLNN